MKTRKRINDWIVSELSKTLNVKNGDLSSDLPFFQLGLSSLDLVDFAKDIEKEFGLEFNPILFFDYSTISSLAKYLTQQVASGSEKEIDVDLDQKREELNSFCSQPLSLGVVGLACRFPGASNYDEFWEHIRSEKTAFQKISEEPRFLGRCTDSPLVAGFLENVDCFDSKLFNIADEEAINMDPQQRVLLEQTWRAIEDSSLAFKELQNYRTGVFVGISTNDYLVEKTLSGKKTSVYDGVGFAHSIAANRLSYFFNFTGPSVAVDTACSSSLVALHLACQSLRQGECDFAIVGGVNLLLSPHPFEIFDKANMLSRTGALRAFSDDADGYVRAEGCGVVILTREDLARENDLSLRALVKGSAINQDGQTNTITAPSGRSQVDVINKAMRNSGLNADEIDYIEAHGTGTHLGDPVEFEALRQVFQDRKDRIHLGTVKTNIGHLEAAAGIAGFIKSILCLENSYLPSICSFNKVNPQINEKKSLINILSDGEMLPHDDLIRIGVSSFGFGGTNAHVILETAKNEQKQDSFSLERPLDVHCFKFSATSLGALKKTLKNFLSQRENYQDLLSLSYWMHENDKGLPYQFHIWFHDHQELCHSMDSFLKTEVNAKHVNGSNWIYSEQNQKSSPSTVFVFSGQGTQYSKMGYNLYLNHQTFRDTFNQVLDRFQPFFDKNLIDVWLEENTRELFQTDYSQALIFAVEIALFEMMKSFDCLPDVMVGHSLGEISALTCAGAISISDACRVVAMRGKAMQNSPEGKMLIVFAEKATIDKVLYRNNIELDYAAHNSSRAHVLSGSPSDINRLEIFLEKEGVKTRIFASDRAYHSKLLREESKNFKRAIDEFSYQSLDIPVVSCICGDFVSVESLNADYWYRHLLEPTHFQSAIEKIEKKYSSLQFVEIGPDRTLLKLIPYIVKVKGERLIAPIQKEVNSLCSFYQALSLLNLSGLNLTYDSLYSKREVKRVKIPNIAFTNERFWIDRKVLLEQEGDLVNVGLKFKSEEELAQYIRNVISKDLDLDSSQISFQDDLINLGADSLVLLNTLENINEKFQSNISIADVFEKYRSIELLSKYLFLRSSEKSRNVKEIDNKPSINEKNEKIESKGVLGLFKNQYHGNINGDLAHQNNKQRADYLQSLQDKFIAKTKKSKELVAKYRKKLADNRVSAGFRPDLKEMVYPIHCRRAKGSYFWDIDGNKFIDFTMGFGVNLFGHSPDFIQEAIKHQLELGMAVGPQSERAPVVADLMCSLTGDERVAFVNSGTEAVMTAIRLARAYTKKNTLVIFEGAYHGHFDGVLARKNIRGETTQVAPGVPKGIIDDVIVLEYGVKKSLDWIKENASELAAVLVEPVQSRHPDLVPKDFLKQIESITREVDCALIFDEVITGFRCHLGGAKALFGVHADISTYGKIIGGGLPIGAIGGSAKYLDFIDGGDWSFGDNTYPKNEMTFFAGTFCKHPMVMAASEAVFLQMQSRGEKIIDELDQKTSDLAQKLNAFFIEAGLEIKVIHFSSLFRFKFTGNLDWLFFELNCRGFYVWEGRNMFLSTAHTDDDIESFIEAVKDILRDFLSIGYVERGDVNHSTEQASTDVFFDMIPSQKRFAEVLSSDCLYDRVSTQIVTGLKISGQLDTSKLITSIETLVQSRYDSILCSYQISKFKLSFNRNQLNFKVTEMDFSSLPDNQEVYRDWKCSVVSNVLDINVCPLEIYLCKLSEQEFQLIVVMSHLVADGLSLAFIFDEIAKLYNVKDGKEVKLNQIRPFQEYMAEYFGNIEKLTTSEKYWKNQLESFPPKTFRRHKISSPITRKSFRIHRVLNESIFKNVRFFGYKNKSSFLTTLLTVFSEVLDDHFKSNHFVIGVPAAGHQSISSTMIGSCVNLTPLLLERKPGQSRAKFIEELKENQLEAFKHADFPYLSLVESRDKDPVEIVFNLEPISELPKLEGTDLDLISLPVVASEYPIMVNVMRLNSRLHIDLDVQEWILSEKQADELLSSFSSKLEELS